ncbi:hypothetical protein SESBI_16388 [Sesbania bispinosa]|nr:hypothetical protein SESBI_16388 [Sesbania bispinosa]
MTSSLIKELFPTKEDWRLKVKVSRLWDVPRRDSKGVAAVNMILIDEEGNKIQASIFQPELISKFESCINEGNCYNIENLSIGENSGNYKSTKHPYRITFGFETKVTPCEAVIPDYAFDFAPFDKILSEKNPMGHLIDIIGTIAEISQLQQFNFEGESGKRLEIKLADERDNFVRFTLFGDSVVDVFNSVSAGSDDTKIMVMQLARIKPFKGQNYLATSWNTTKIFINPNIPEVEKFKNMLGVSLPNLTPTQSNTQLSSGSSSYIDELGNPALRRTLIEIRDAKQTVRDKDGFLLCTKCHKTPSKVIPRFRTHLMVMDQTGSACFVLFEKQGVELFNKTANELREEMVKDGNDSAFPPILETLVGRKFVFMIEINAHFNLEKKSNNYTILKLSYDTRVIQEFDTSSAVSQEYQGPAISSTQEQDNFQSSVHNEIGQASLTAENDTDICSKTMITPHKRKKKSNSSDCEITGVNQVLSPKLSTTKSSVRVKIEKKK